MKRIKQRWENRKVGRDYRREYGDIVEEARFKYIEYLVFISKLEDHSRSIQDKIDDIKYQRIPPNSGRKQAIVIYKSNKKLKQKKRDLIEDRRYVDSAVATARENMRNFLSDLPFQEFQFYK